MPAVSLCRKCAIKCVRDTAEGPTAGAGLASMVQSLTATEWLLHCQPQEAQLQIGGAAFEGRGGQN